MKKLIYIIRHGQTENNKNNIIQGGTVDASLNETGRLQGKAFYEYYKDTPFELVYTSKLIRTKQTIQDFLDNGLHHEALTAINELSFGVYDGTKIYPGRDDDFNQVLKKWEDGDTAIKHEKGQSPEDIVIQQKEFIERLKTDDFSTALVCMHGRAMRILVSTLMGTPLKDMKQYEHHNTCLYLFQFDGEKFDLLKRNDITHLELNQGQEQLIFKK